MGGFNFFQKLRMAQVGVAIMMPSPLATVGVDSLPLGPVEGSLEGLVNLQEPLLRPEFVGELREPGLIQLSFLRTYWPWPPLPGAQRGISLTWPRQPGAQQQALPGWQAALEAA